MHQLRGAVGARRRRLERGRGGAARVPRRRAPPAGDLAVGLHAMACTVLRTLPSRGARRRHAQPAGRCKLLQDVMHACAARTHRSTPPSRALPPPHGYSSPMMHTRGIPASRGHTPLPTAAEKGRRWNGPQQHERHSARALWRAAGELRRGRGGFCAFEVLCGGRLQRRRAVGSAGALLGRVAAGGPSNQRAARRWAGLAWHGFVGGETRRTWMFC